MKFLRYFINGITHNLILWMISKNKIHGYAIMKKLEEFFDIDNCEFDFKITSSKVYPILKKMEENNLIVSEWEIQNNKPVKFYSITDEGQLVLCNLIKKLNTFSKTPVWIDFFNDILRDDVDECN